MKTHKIYENPQKIKKPTKYMKTHKIYENPQNI